MQTNFISVPSYSIFSARARLFVNFIAQITSYSKETSWLQRVNKLLYSVYLSVSRYLST